MRPNGPPLGLLLANTSKAVGRAFNTSLAESGGSIPIWLILNALKSELRRTQLVLARAVGIEGPTLTRHLDGMEQAGLVRRQRGTLDRRAVQVELTRAGHALHSRLLKTVISFNQKLRTGLSGDEEETLRSVLARLLENVGERR
ncbi:MAG: MarR family winged helix-turn-helix transcriptional regulator [Gaiellales bacterium]